MDYPITYNDLSIGTATVEKEKLYCRICCRCRLPTEGIWRIELDAGDQTRGLGTCILLDNRWGMDTKIPAKMLENRTLRFRAISPDSQQCCPVEDMGEFSQLDRALDSYFRRVNGKAMLQFKD